MEVKRKIQLGAAATVIANALLALTAMAPGDAMAACHAPINGCIQCNTGNPTAACQSLAPGCTVASATCNFDNGCPIMHGGTRLICSYN